MAILRPFRAVRPHAQVAHRVASPPYDVLSVAEARELARGNPQSFLHVTRPEIDLAPDIDVHADAVYARGRDNWLRMRAEGTLIREQAPALYAYRLRRGSHQQTGVAATFAVADVLQGVVKAHERTRRDKEDDRTRHIETLAAQTGPVFLAYRTLAPVATVLERTTTAPPLYDFTADDGVMHTLWRLEPGDSEALVSLFASDVAALYIADGHHRAAAATRVARAWRDAHSERAVAGDREFFLAVAFAHDQLQILPYHRTVRDLGGRTPAEFLAVLAARPAVRDLAPSPPPPRAAAHVSMYVGGTWYAFTLASQHAADPVRGLDTQVLQDEVLEPLLGIGDPRADSRIDFVGGVHGTEALSRRVDGGDAAVAFAMHPLAMDALLRVADAGAFLPPKSTWFEPKLRDGLLVHEFEPARESA